jgi:hypothetical protein
MVGSAVGVATMEADEPGLQAANAIETVVRRTERRRIKRIDPGKEFRVGILIFLIYINRRPNRNP